MSMLSYNELLELIEQGVIRPGDPNFPLDVNGASIDVRISSQIMVESPAASILEIGRSNPKHLAPVILRETGFLVRPRQIILASTLEVLELPNDIVAEFVLKSSIGRLFFNQMQSNFADPGFTGSITLELQNSNEQHSIRVTPNVKIGQMVFHRVKEVPAERSYRVVGQYNNIGEQTKGPMIGAGAR